MDREGIEPFSDEGLMRLCLPERSEVQFSFKATGEYITGPHFVHDDESIEHITVSESEHSVYQKDHELLKHHVGDKFSAVSKTMPDIFAGDHNTCPRIDRHAMQFYDRAVQLFAEKDSWANSSASNNTCVKSPTQAKGGVKMMRQSRPRSVNFSGSRKLGPILVVSNLIIFHSTRVGNVQRESMSSVYIARKSIVSSVTTPYSNSCDWHVVRNASGHRRGMVRRHLVHCCDWHASSIANTHFGGVVRSHAASANEDNAEPVCQKRITCSFGLNVCDMYSRQIISCNRRMRNSAYLHNMYSIHTHDITYLYNMYSIFMFTRNDKGMYIERRCTYCKHKHDSA